MAGKACHVVGSATQVGLTQALGAMDRSLAWSQALFAVLGAFIVGGLGAAIAANFAGLWEMPVAGCVAAFSVVLSAFLFAPRHKTACALVTFFAGATAAWVLVGQSYFPESYGAPLAYQPTYIPFLVTLAGGCLGLLSAFVLHWRQATRRLGA